MRKKAYREVLGQRLKEFREGRGISSEKVARDGGISPNQVEAIERGETNYTMDEFLGYISGSELYMYFAEKSPERSKPHDFEDLAKRAAENNPKI